MKSTLKLTKPIWNTPERRKRLAGVIFDSAFEFESEVKQGFTTQGAARGRTYRLNAITKRPSKRLNGLRLRKRGRSLIVGYNFHRASTAGQSPAIKTGGLRNSVRTKRISQLRARVFVGKNYGAVLDAKNKLNRPFFAERFRKQKPKFLGRIRREMRSMT